MDAHKGVVELEGVNEPYSEFRKTRGPALPLRAAGAPVSRAPTLRIASAAGGRVGHSTRRPSARPTSGRAREALFDILQERIPGRALLELYAGSGAVGFEALSRGASRAVLRRARAGVAASGTLERLAPEPGTAELLAGDAAAAVARSAPSARARSISCSPTRPYGAASRDERPRRERSRLLAEDGIFVLQTDGSWRARRGHGRPAPARAPRLRPQRLFWLSSRASTRARF